MINRTIYNTLIEDKALREMIAKNGKEYAIFTYSRPKNINYPAIVFRIDEYEVKTEIETNELTIEVYSKDKDFKENYKIANRIIDKLDHHILKHPDNIDLRLYLASEIGYKEIEIDDIRLIKMRFLIRGPLNKWVIK